MSKRIFDSKASFDVKSSKAKFPVLGRTVKGSTVNVAKTRSKDVNKRKQALKQMLQNSGKTNKFVDNRLGEGEDAITQDEKDTMRYQRLRTEQLKGSTKGNSKYSLQDNEELTHMGQSLGAMSSEQMSGHLDSDSSDSDNEKDGRMSAEATRFSNFGGGVLEGEKRTMYDHKNSSEKTKYDIFKEIIQNSKMYKEQRKQDADQLQTDLNNLDAEFDDIKALLRYKVDSDEDDDIPEVGLDGKFVYKNNDKNTDPSETVNGMSLGANVGKDSYFAQSNELQMSKRAVAGSRLRSDEEIAKARYNLLVKKEKERLKRVNGGDDDELDDDEIMGWSNKNDDSSSSESEGESVSKRGNKKTFTGYTSDLVDMSDDDEDVADSADDEDDDEDAADDEDNDDDDDDDDDKPVVAKKGVSADFDDVGGNVAYDDDFMIHSDSEGGESDLEESMMKRDAAEKQAKKEKALKKKQKRDMAELDLSNEDLSIPFTFEAPVEYAQYKELLAGSASDNNIQKWETILSRIRTQYNPKLHHTNEFKMQRLYTHLFRHFKTICTVESKVTEQYEVERDNDKKKNLNKYGLLSCKFSMRTLDMLVRQLFATREMFYRYAKNVDREVLKNITKNIHARRLENTSTSLSCWPSAHELLTLHALTKLYPVTDSRHIVTTPLFIVFCEILTYPVKGMVDLAKGLFVCSLLLEYVQETRRYVPEVVAFLHTALMTVFEVSSADVPATYTNGDATNDILPRDVADYVYNLELLTPAFTTKLAGMAKKINFCGDIPQIPVVYSKAKAPEMVVANKVPLSLLFLQENQHTVLHDSSIVNAVANTVVTLVSTMARTYSSLQAFPDMFGPFYAVLNTVITKHTITTEHLGGKIVDTLGELIKLSAKQCLLRKPVAKFARPVAIKEFTPALNDDEKSAKEKMLEKERAETKRLSDKLKKVKRDTARSVRRENQILMQEKQLLHRKDQERREVNRKRVMADLQRESQNTSVLAQVSKKRRTV